VNLLTLWKCGWICSIFVESGWDLTFWPTSFFQIVVFTHLFSPFNPLSDFINLWIWFSQASFSRFTHLRFHLLVDFVFTHFLFPFHLLADFTYLFSPTCRFYLFHLLADFIYWHLSCVMTLMIGVVCVRCNVILTHCFISTAVPQKSIFTHDALRSGFTHFKVSPACRFHPLTDFTHLQISPTCRFHLLALLALSVFTVTSFCPTFFFHPLYRDCRNQLSPTMLYALVSPTSRFHLLADFTHLQISPTSDFTYVQISSTCTCLVLWLWWILLIVLAVTSFCPTVFFHPLYRDSSSRQWRWRCKGVWARRSNGADWRSGWKQEG